MGSKTKLKCCLSWLVVILLVIQFQIPTEASKSNPATTSKEEKKNILFLLPLSSKSHKHVFEPLIRALAAKGHEITVIAATKSANMPPNVREIVVVKDEEIFDVWQDPLENRKNGKVANFFLDMSFAIRVCDKVFESEEVKTLLKTHKNKFDLQYVDLILNQCFYGILSYFEAPFISLATIPPWSIVASKLGTNLPSSFVPVAMLDLPEDMTFIQRVYNNIVNWIAPLIMKWYTSELEKVYQKHLGEHYPSADEIEANASIMLTNSHFSLNTKLPLLPDIIEVGGMHLQQAKPVPKDIEEFLTDANEGFILFSLGSIVRARSMKEETRKTFLRVFSKLKQKVIWKWETDMSDLPPNVKVSKWLPQQDILAHPKLKLFMSHGGLLSIQEAVYHGVPVLGLPVFGDQDINIIKVVNSGFGLFQEILDVNEDDLLDKINALVNDKRYKDKAEQLSKVLRDQPQTPLDRALFWSEYVMRHNGAHHLRSPARNLNFFQYHSLDVLGFLLILLIMTIWLGLCVCRRICCSKKAFSENNKKKLQ